MNIVVDADILFNSIRERSPDNILKRLRNAGHDVFIPLTVLGEVMLTCITEKRREEALRVIDYCGELDPFWMIPNERLRTCCPCIDETDTRIHGFTDKTHLAYAAAYNSRGLTIHYFLTTDEELPHLNLLCKEKCHLDAPEIVNPGTLRAMLLGR
jgi:predicted nucleic acid-binding protein